MSHGAEREAPAFPPHPNPLPRGERGPETPSPLAGEGRGEGADSPRAFGTPGGRFTTRLTRRAMLAACAGAVPALARSASAAADGRTGLGLVIHSFAVRG